MAHECQDIERLAQYIVRNPFSVSKMQVNRSGDSILYRSGMNAKIKRNYFYPRKYSRKYSAREISSRQSSITVTQHIPDKRFQMVRYYGWYFNKMRGQRRKRAEEAQEKATCESTTTADHGCGAGANSAIEIIEHLAPKPRRMPSRSWLELIKLDHKSLGNRSSAVPPMSSRDAPNLTDHDVDHQRRQIIERILQHVGSVGALDLWVNEVCSHGVRIAPSTGPPTTETIERDQLVMEPWLDDPMPEYDCGL